MRRTPGRSDALRADRIEEPEDIDELFDRSNDAVFDLVYHRSIDGTVTEQLVLHALASIALVWRRHMKLPTRIRVEIADNVVDAESGLEVNGVYRISDNTIALALGQLATRSPAAAVGMVIRVASHEAMHAVQHARGDDIVGVPRPVMGDRIAYDAHPAEVEAHIESVDVLKGYYPELTGPLPMGGTDYVVPEASVYTAPWQRVAAGGVPLKSLPRAGQRGLSQRQEAGATA